MKRKVVKKLTPHKLSEGAQLRKEVNGFFTKSTDGNLRLAVVAFLIIALAYALWQRGFFSF